MSNTRHRDTGAPLAQERYLSSTELADNRPINGVAVSARAALLPDPAQRSLLYWIQARSMEAGGLLKLAEKIVTTFPERLGTETMRRQHLAPGGRWPQAAFETICRELGCCEASFDLGFTYPSTTPRFATEARERCRAATLDKLPRLLTELCINPGLPVKTGLAHLPSFGEFSSAEAGTFTTPTLATFADVIAALFELQRTADKQLPESFAETEISRQVFRTLDFALKTRRMVLVEGREGIGKSEAAKAWCAQHEGEARFVAAAGICNKTSFFREISRVLGIGASYTRKTTDMQARVEDVLKRSGVLLVIDEAHFLFGHSERISTRPELIDWLHTIYNHGVAIALLCTPQLLLRMSRTEIQTGWNSGQFKRRVKRWTLLPEHPSEADFKAIAARLLADADERAREAALCYAIPSKRNLSALVDVADEARFIAREAGRERITLADMRSAISDYRLPSDNAMFRAVSAPAPAGRRPRQRLRSPVAPALQEPFTAEEMALNGGRLQPRPGAPRERVMVEETADA